MKRNRGDLFVLVGLLLVFVVTTVLIAGQIHEAPDLIPHRTSYSAKPGGLKVAYLLLRQGGVPAERLVAKPQHWPKDAHVIITATPFAENFMEESWDKREVDATKHWIDEGGTLILLQEQTTDLMKSLKLDVDTYLKTDATLSPQQPATFLGGVHSVTFPDNQRFVKVPPEAVPLFGDRKPALLVLRRGKGMILAVANPAVFDNTSLRLADNATLLVQMVQFARNGTGKVYFDEFHQGYGVEESLWTMIGKPGQFLSYQLLLLVILAAYTVGRRFGLAHAMPSASRVSSEYVASLADLYRRARATDAALEGVYLVFWRDLCRAVGVPFDTSIGEIARRGVALAVPGSDRFRLEKDLQRLLGECEDKMAAGPKVLDERTLLRLANELEDMRKELQLGGND